MLLPISMFKACESVLHHCGYLTALSDSEVSGKVSSSGSLCCCSCCSVLSWQSMANSGTMFRRVS